MRHTHQCRLLQPLCQVSANASGPGRIRPPRNSRRIPLPQLERILAARGRNQSDLATLLGLPRQEISAGKRKGFFEADARRIAAYLGVELATLRAAGVDAPDTAPSVQALLQQPTIARLSVDVGAEMQSLLDRALAAAMAEAVRLLASGTVAVPDVSALRPSLLTLGEQAVHAARGTALPRPRQKKAR